MEKNHLLEVIASPRCLSFLLTVRDEEYETLCRDKKLSRSIF